MLDERTEHAYENRRINAVTNKIHGREAIRRSSFNVGNNQDNRYMLRAEDSFSRYCRKHPIPNKEAHTVAKVLMDQPSTSMGCLNPSTNPVERQDSHSHAENIRTRSTGYLGFLVERFCVQQYRSYAQLRHVWVQSNITCGFGLSNTVCGEENYVSLDW